MKLCENCTNCKLSPRNNDLEWRNFDNALCMASETEAAKKYSYVCQSVPMPDVDKYSYCTIVRGQTQLCENFCAKPYSDGAIDEHHRFDDECVPNYKDPVEVEDGL